MSPEDARWEVRDRDRLLRLVEKLPSFRIFHDNGLYSIERVLKSSSVHIFFINQPEGRAVSIIRRDRDKHTIGLLVGGLRGWIVALGISLNDLLEAFL
jgi:hypothetical protein